MKNKKNAYKKPIYIRATGIIRHPGAKITHNFIGKRVSIYNGRLYQSFNVLRDMIGYKFGFFITTKSLGPKIHLTANKKKKLKKK